MANDFDYININDVNNNSGVPAGRIRQAGETDDLKVVARLGDLQVIATDGTNKTAVVFSGTNAQPHIAPRDDSNVDLGTRHDNRFNWAWLQGGLGVYDHTNPGKGTVVRQDAIFAMDGSYDVNGDWVMADFAQLTSTKLSMNTTDANNYAIVEGEFGLTVKKDGNTLEASAGKVMFNGTYGFYNTGWAQFDNVNANNFSADNGYGAYGSTYQTFYGDSGFQVTDLGDWNKWYVHVSNNYVGFYEDSVANTRSYGFTKEGNADFNAVDMTTAKFAPVTTADLPTYAVEGAVVFNTDTKKLACFDGTIWNDLF